MIHFRIIAVGKIKEPWIKAGLKHYYKLLSGHAAIEEITVRAEKIIDDSQKDIILKKEAKSILARLKNDDVVICLDERGALYDSYTFADHLNRCFNSGKNAITLVIGSPLGLSDEVKSKADMVLALSKLTFPHELTKLILAEQLYRALSIISGGKYHK